MKHSMILNYAFRVVLTRKLPMVRLFAIIEHFKDWPQGERSNH